MKPRLLDLFCKAGGAAAGYAAAGFEVVGVDIELQRSYPFEGYQGDALVFLERFGREFDAIHASPPCQAFSVMKDMPDAREHPRLIGPVRELLRVIGKPYVIENVVGARSELVDPVLLCGTMFGLSAAGFELQRHRLFETSFPLAAPGGCRHELPVIGVYGGHVRCRSNRFWRGGADFPGFDKKQLAMTAMGVSHPMTMVELSEAIPPQYTEFVGRRLMAHLSDSSTAVTAAVAGRSKGAAA